MAPDGKKAVWMADDDADDCMLASEAFAEINSDAAFLCVEDGVELLENLAERSESRGLPDLILLDLNMPRKDGRKALLEIKSEPVLRHIPIVILTTSKEQKDISFTMAAGAVSFITKPDTFDEWVAIMKSLVESWLS
jgi:CheY-like chemotaxis protein